MTDSVPIGSYIGGTGERVYIRGRMNEPLPPMHDSWKSHFVRDQAVPIRAALEQAKADVLALAQEADAEGDQASASFCLLAHTQIAGALALLDHVGH